MLQPLKAGEYDLANISLIGHDPVTGRTYAECNAEWQAALEELKARNAKRRWWQVRELYAVRRQTAILSQRLGF